MYGIVGCAYGGLPAEHVKVTDCARHFLAYQKISFDTWRQIAGLPCLVVVSLEAVSVVQGARFGWELEENIIPGASY